MDKQTAKFIARIAENLPEMSGVSMQDWIDDPKGLQKFLLGLKSKNTKVTLVQETNNDVGFSELGRKNLFDFTIKVDRVSARLSYPRSKKKLLNPELEFLGLKEYDLKKEVEFWLHFKQKNGPVSGHEIYSKLQTENLLSRCLGLADLVAILAKGNDVHHNLYREIAVFAWKSAIEDRLGRRYAPGLFWSGERLLIDWRIFDHSWGGLAVRRFFSKNKYQLKGPARFIVLGLNLFIFTKLLKFFLILLFPPHFRRFWLVNLGNEHYGI
jgi:hypothetical protein